MYPIKKAPGTKSGRKIGLKLQQRVVGAVARGVQVRTQDLFGQGEIVLEHGCDDVDMLLIRLEEAVRLFAGVKRHAQVQAFDGSVIGTEQIVVAQVDNFGVERVILCAKRPDVGIILAETAEQLLELLLRKSVSVGAHGVWLDEAAAFIDVADLVGRDVCDVDPLFWENLDDMLFGQRVERGADGGAADVQLADQTLLRDIAVRCVFTAHDAVTDGCIGIIAKISF